MGSFPVVFDDGLVWASFATQTVLVLLLFVWPGLLITSVSWKTTNAAFSCLGQVAFVAINGVNCLGFFEADLTVQEIRDTAFQTRQLGINMCVLGLVLIVFVSRKWLLNDEGGVDQATKPSTSNADIARVKRTLIKAVLFTFTFLLLSVPDYSVAGESLHRKWVTIQLRELCSASRGTRCSKHPFTIYIEHVS